MFARMLHCSPAPRTARHTKQHFTVEALEGRQLMSLGVQFTVSVPTPAAQVQSANDISANASSVVVWTNFSHGEISDQRLANPKFFPRVVSTNVPHGAISDQRLANPKFVPLVVSTNVPHGDAQVASQILNSQNGKVGRTLGVASAAGLNEEWTILPADIVIKKTTDSTSPVLS
jgi:hypothetical protein